MSALDWMADALCAQVSPDMFFPEKSKGVAKAAIRVCEACPVRDECLRYALENRFDDGIFGGLTPNGRRKLLRKARGK